MLKLDEFFHSGMLLQRGCENVLWGTSDCEDEIEVSINGAMAAACRIDAGEVRIALPPHPAMEDAVIHICGKHTDVTLHHVDYGELFIAGGQSNMWFPAEFDAEYRDCILGKVDEHIRYYDIGQYAFVGEREEGLKDDRHFDRWSHLGGELTADYSAVAVYFALKLKRRLQVPVGIVGCYWPGSSASAWVKESILRQNPALKVYTDAYDKATEGLDIPEYLQRDEANRRAQETAEGRAFMRQVHRQLHREPPSAELIAAERENAAKFQTGPHDFNRPGGLYDTMVLKLQKVRASAVLWYQGESDEGRAAIYPKLFAALMQNWRELLGEQIPFFYVQLAPFEAWRGCGGEHYHELREAQQIVEDMELDAHMVSIMDVGERWDIHPKRKRPVGERLADLVMTCLYQNCDLADEQEREKKKRISRNPRMKNMRRSGNQIAVTFENVWDGLEARGDCSGLFEITLHGERVPAVCRIDGDTVVLEPERELTREEFAELKVSLAYRPYVNMTIFEKNGMPLRPFAPHRVYC